MTLGRWLLLIALLLLVSSCGMPGTADPESTGEIQDGAYTFTEADSAYPDLYRRALAHAESGEYEEAEALYRNLTELEPENPNGFIGLASALIAQGRYDDAAAAYERALEISPNAVEAHIGLGSVAALQEDYEGSRHHYARAVELAPENPNAHWGLALLLESTGETAEAITHFEQVVVLAEETGLAHDAQRRIDQLVSD
jgi:tetratricopeptide (TPR) repeat protein